MTNVKHKFSSMCLCLFITLYMFRAHSAHHQERRIVSIQPMVTVIIYGGKMCAGWKKTSSNLHTFVHHVGQSPRICFFIRKITAYLGYALVYFLHHICLIVSVKISVRIGTISMERPTELYWIVLNCTELYWIVMNCTELYWIVLNCTQLYWIVRNCTQLYWIVLNCTQL